MIIGLSDRTLASRSRPPEGCRGAPICLSTWQTGCGPVSLWRSQSGGGCRHDQPAPVKSSHPPSSAVVLGRHAQAREAALVVMLIQFRPLDRHAIWFENAANVVGMRQQFAGCLDGGISRPRRARLRQSTNSAKTTCHIAFMAPSAFPVCFSGTGGSQAASERLMRCTPGAAAVPQCCAAATRMGPPTGC